MLIYPMINGLEMFSSRQTDVRTETDTELLSELSEGRVETVRQNITAVQKELSDKQAESQKQAKKKEILEKLDKGELSYRNLFKDVYIMGDSLMNGLEVYDVLNSNNLITQVSASLYHLNDNIDKMVGMKPEILIIHYGLNHVEDAPQQPANFISLYGRIVAKIKESLPDTRIIVSGIFPVDTDKARDKHYKRIDAYNDAIEEMCNQLGVEYLDNTAAFRNAEEYYAGDGIHLNGDFYQERWLRHIVAEKEIYR